MRRPTPAPTCSSRRATTAACAFGLPSAALSVTECRSMRRSFDQTGRLSGWVVVSGDGLRRVFDARGLLQSISDAAGNVLTVEWDSYPALREVLALLPWARAADFDFRITKIHDTTGRKI